LLGSCFSENIGKKLAYFKFQNFQNPFGILFHPKAIETLIFNAIINKKYSEADVFFHNEQWHCFDAHSKLSNASKENLLIDLNKEIKSTNQQLRNSSHIIITLGTAWAYRFSETNNLVANCHKVPQKQFKKELFSVEEITNSLKSIVGSIRGLNPETSIIFTLSPVRHLKDGFIENTLSKAHLIAAIHNFLNQKSSRDSYRDVNCQSFYFPSYEIMMDELRDYRFFAEDMMHPNKTAINYIWERFKMVWISENVFKTMEAVEVIQKGMLHTPFNANSVAHKKFLQNLEAQKSELQSLFPHIKF
jgi:hypothetical protein